MAEELEQEGPVSEAQGENLHQAQGGSPGDGLEQVGLHSAALSVEEQRVVDLLQVWRGRFTMSRITDLNWWSTPCGSGGR